MRALWLLLLFAGSTWAYEPLEQVPCQVTPKGLYYCIDPARPESSVEAYVDTPGQTPRLAHNVAVTCSEGTCLSLRQVYYGRVPVKIAALVHSDYYLGVDTQGKVTSYLRGTGPDWGAPEPDATNTPALRGLGIWCNPLGEYCSTPKGDLKRPDLPKHYPYYQGPVNAQIECDLELCTTVEGEVLGLNPEYSGYKN